MPSYVQLERFRFRLFELRRAVRAAKAALDFLFAPFFWTTRIRREMLRVRLLIGYGRCWAV